jgi:hypothetical protein
MRGAILIQVCTVILTASVAILSTYLVSIRSGPEEFEKTFKMGAFSDIHAEARYDPWVSNEEYCTPPPRGFNNLTESGLEDFKNDSYAPLGRFFCNPPAALFDKMLQKMKYKEPNLDILFITGDFIGHFTNNRRNRPYDPKRYDTLMGVH